MIYYPFTPHTVPLSIHLQPHRRLQLRRRQDLLRKNGNVTKVPYVEHVPPDLTACIFWLKNRDPAHTIKRVRYHSTPYGGASFLAGARTPRAGANRSTPNARPLAA